MAPQVPLLSYRLLRSVTLCQTICSFLPSILRSSGPTDPWGWMKACGVGQVRRRWWTLGNIIIGPQRSIHWQFPPHVQRHTNTHTHKANCLQLNCKRWFAFIYTICKDRVALFWNTLILSCAVLILIACAVIAEDRWILNWLTLHDITLTI